MSSYKADSHLQTLSIDKNLENTEDTNDLTPQPEHTPTIIGESAADRQAVEHGIIVATGSLDSEVAETGESGLSEVIQLQYEVQDAAGQEQHEIPEHTDDASTEGSVSEQEQRKRKPERSSDGEKLPKRLCIESGDTQRKQYTSPFEIPFEPTERMQQIEKYERKRSLNYVPNRDSAVFKSDGGRNNISVEAHLVQERGEVHQSRCNSCGNKSRPAGPWKECVSLEGFLRGSCANCHINGSGARCSLRRKFKSP
jgi:hypothetical protein